MYKYLKGFLMKLLKLFSILNRKLSMKKKIFLSYIFLILIPACLLMYFYYQNTSSIIEKGVTNSILQALKQTEINISYRLEAVENVSNILFMNKDFHTYLGQDDENSPIGQVIDNWKNMNRIIAGAQDNKDIFKIRVFVSSNKLYSGELDNFLPLSSIQNKEWYSGVIENNGRIFWRDTTLERYLHNEYMNVISCMRMMRNPEKYDDLAGILSVDIQESYIYEIISKIDITGRQNIFIVDGEGKIISCYDKDKLGSEFPNSLATVISADNEGTFKVKNNNKEVYVIHKGIAKTDWKIVAQIPAEEIRKNNRTFSNISGIIMIISTLIVFMLALFLFAAFLTEGIHRRVRTLIYTMEKEGMESITDSYPSSDGDIYKLEKSFDTMIKTVKRLTEESLKAKLHEREAELKALQAQINPHFLYNTLDIVNWMAIRRGVEDIRIMVDSIAKYFRYSLSRGRDVVRICDEIELVEVYQDIQKKRFGDIFTVNFNVDDEAKQYHIPKLTLQPLVENAILHGILEKNDSGGKITIEAKKNGDDISIIISDNGIGIKSEIIEGLLKGDNLNGNNSYGLYNVNERIKLFSSGDKYGVFISSIEGEGTTVEVKLKAI
jgi:two-component system, sensor histidine kinase YesM